MPSKVLNVVMVGNNTPDQIKTIGKGDHTIQIPTVPSSNWQALKQKLRPIVNPSSKSKATTAAAASPPSDTNGVTRDRTAGTSQKNPLKRRRSSIDSSSETRTTKSLAAAAAEGSLTSLTTPSSSPIKLSDKGKGRDHVHASREDRKQESAAGKEKVKKTSKTIPVSSILEGGSAAWQQEIGQYLAVDCEMVGVGPEGVESTLARVSIVNYHGVTMLDRFVRPREKVTDYRTWVSGVREEDLRNAPAFAEVQREVADLIKDKVLIGHALSNDTRVLLLSHSWTMTRDTAKYGPLQTLAKSKKPGLKTLAKLVLGVEIQTGEHSSVDDARTTMAIYRSQKSAWEDSLRTHTKPVLTTSSTPALASLALNDGNLNELGRSKINRVKSLGLAATMRHVRAEEAERAAHEPMGEEETQIRAKKKARTEEKDDLVVGFDYVPAVVPSKPSIVDSHSDGSKAGSKSKSKHKNAVGKVDKMDRERRPKTKDGWWEEI